MIRQKLNSLSTQLKKKITVSDINLTFYIFHITILSVFGKVYIIFERFHVILSSYQAEIALASGVLLQTHVEDS